MYPTKGLTYRDIAKLAATSVSTASRLLNAIGAESLIKIVEEKNMKRVYGNFDSRRFVYYKRLSNMEQLSELVMFLIEEKHPDAVIVFGSYGKGEDIEESDIDVFLENPKSNKKFEFGRFEKKLGRKIQLFEGRLKNFETGMQKNIIKGVICYGDIAF